MKRIALYHLETLLWIARLGTFSAAAERLNTTQPSVSARVRELEGQLGFAIFRRQGRNMSLTVRGRQLVSDCEPLWAMIERTLLAPGDYAAASGIVRIGAGEIAAASCLPGFVTETKRALPGVSLEIEVDLTANLLQNLLSAKTDIVFLVGPVVSPAITAVPIGHVRLAWLASPALAAAIRGGGKERGGRADVAIWSLPHHSPLHRIMVGEIRAAAVPHRTINTCNNARTLIDIVAADGGIGLFPETMVRGHIADGTLVRVLDRTPAPILFEAAIRTDENEPIVLEMFRRAGMLEIGAAR